MATQKKSLNPTRVGMVVVSLLMLVFLIWAARSCGEGSGNYAMVAEERARQNYLDSLQRAEDSVAVLSAAQKEARERAEALQRATTQPLIGDSVVRVPEPLVIREKTTPLYVTFEGLNVRSGPGMNYGRIDRLALFEEVTFLNEVTDSSYQIDLGQVTPNEPWVKILTPSGKEGWVYGAGVDYYKRQLHGVEN